MPTPLLTLLPLYGLYPGILGDFQQQWAASGNPPLQIFTKYVPNIFNSRPTPATVEAAIKRSMGNLKVCMQSQPGIGAAVKSIADSGTDQWWKNTIQAAASLAGVAVNSLAVLVCSALEHQLAGSSNNQPGNWPGKWRQ